MGGAPTPPPAPSGQSPRPPRFAALSFPKRLVHNRHHFKVQGHVSILPKLSFSLFLLNILHSPPRTWDSQNHLVGGLGKAAEQGRRRALLPPAGRAGAAAGPGAQRTLQTRGRWGRPQGGGGGGGGRLEEPTPSFSDAAVNAHCLRHSPGTWGTPAGRPPHPGPLPTTPEPGRPRANRGEQALGTGCARQSPGEPGGRRAKGPEGEGLGASVPEAGPECLRGGGGGSLWAPERPGRPLRAQRVRKGSRDPRSEPPRERRRGAPSGGGSAQSPAQAPAPGQRAAPQPRKSQSLPTELTLTVFSSLVRV